MGCHPSHWRTHIFQRGRVETTNQDWFEKHPLELMSRNSSPTKHSWIPCRTRQLWWVKSPTSCAQRTWLVFSAEATQPPVIKHGNWTSSINEGSWLGKSSINGWFFIATFDCRMVHDTIDTQRKNNPCKLHTGKLHTSGRNKETWV